MNHVVVVQLHDLKSEMQSRGLMKRAVSILIRVLFTGLILGIGFISFWAWTYSRDLPNLNTLEGV